MVAVDEDDRCARVLIPVSQRWGRRAPVSLMRRRLGIAEWATVLVVLVSMVLAGYCDPPPTPSPTVGTVSEEGTHSPLPMVPQSSVPGGGTHRSAARHLLWKDPVFESD